MDDLELNIDFAGDGGVQGPNLSWKERKRQAHKKHTKGRPLQGGAYQAAQTSRAAPGGKDHGRAPQIAANHDRGYSRDLKRTGTAATSALGVQQASPQRAAAGAGAGAVGQPAKRQKQSPSIDASLGGTEAEADLMELVAFSLRKEQALQAELAGSSNRAAPHQPPSEEAGVVEFGDAEDEPDYHHLAGKGSNNSGSAGAGGQQPDERKRGRARQQQPQHQHKSQQQPLEQHKVGQLAHAEMAVPQEERAVLFGSAPDIQGLPHQAAAGGASSWEGLGVVPSLSEHLEALNFSEPTLVQQAAIPVLLAGRDALVRSATGSGKTLAYLVPLVHLLQGASPRISRADGSLALVLAPTRELALQILDVLSALLRRYHWLVGGLLVGGENRNHEKARLRKGVTVVVATPGRLLDHLEKTHSFQVGQVRHLVLDEADRLLDLGFESQLRAIVTALDSRQDPAAATGAGAAGGVGVEGVGSKARQTVMISATLHPGLQALANVSMMNPVAIGFSQQQLSEAAAAAEASRSGADAEEGTTGARDGAAAAAGQGGGFDVPRQLKQHYVEVPLKLRLTALIGALSSRLRRSKVAKLVVFFNSCDSVDFHHALLAQGGSGSSMRTPAAGSLKPGAAAAAAAAAAAGPLVPGRVIKLHGDMPQAERTSSFLTFVKASSGVLLCTDVAARGLDFPSVTCTLQYDAAGEPSEYVHRVGRTARMGHKGEALLFVLPSEAGYLTLLASQGVHLTEESLPSLLRCLPGEQSQLVAMQRHKRGWKAGGQLGKLEGAAGEHAGVALEFQRALMRRVGADPHLKALAQAAFRSSIGAYSVHPKHLKPIFNIRSLHLGHMVAAFGLAEPPSAIGGSGAAAERKKRKREATQSASSAMRRAMKKGSRAVMDMV